jgi:hypothetical protein
VTRVGLQGLNDFEQAVLDKLLAGEHPVLTTLRGQVAKARVVSRERTGVGFFCTFDVPSDAPAVASPQDFELSDVDADVDGLAHGAGFLLFVRRGYVNKLEGYSYEEPWSAEPRTYRLKYRHEPRRLEWKW